MRFLAVLVGLSIVLSVAHATPTPVPVDFWTGQKRGTNFFNSSEKPERWKAAAEFGVSFVRLAPSKWLNGRAEADLGDFLIGKSAAFQTIDPKDLQRLNRVLDDAHRSGLKVILTLLSLPGARWGQHNGGTEERELWKSFEQQDRAIRFWSLLARALKGHPALVGYNIRNEPSPERVNPALKDWYSGDYEAWYRSVKGTPADLNLFYRKMVEAIRRVDAETPIVLDCGFYATPTAFKVFEPLQDDKILYSFHMYEPYDFTNHANQGKYAYPGLIPIGELDVRPLRIWDRKRLAELMQPVADWQKRNKIPSDRILVGEFGVYRSNQGAEAYLRDLISVFNEHKWHWAFYAFREDTWAGMDYELGTSAANTKYWEAIENDRMPGPEAYRANPLSDLLKAAVNGREF